MTHNSKHNQEDESLADLVLKKYPEIDGVGEGEMRAGIVHRLDKNVSGLIVVARTQVMFDALKKQFQERVIEKVYTALVYGKIEKEYDSIAFPIERSTKGYKMAAKPMGTELTGGVREALSEFEVIRRFINYTLVSVRIKTGRTHQIRCHLTAYGCPIVGDDVYSTAKTRIANKKLSLGRVFLHSTKLGFRDLDGEKVELESKLPLELEDLLNKVK